MSDYSTPFTDGILHEAEDRKGPPDWKNRGGLVSLLEIMYAGSMTCDHCGRWQKTVGFGADLEAALAETGWVKRGILDLCQLCGSVASIDPTPAAAALPESSTAPETGSQPLKTPLPVHLL
jgi:hypothetical protein